MISRTRHLASEGIAGAEQHGAEVESLVALMQVRPQPNALEKYRNPVSPLIPDVHVAFDPVQHFGGT